MLKKLTAKHRRMIRDLVTGRDPKDIAKDLKISSQTILKLQRDDPLFKSEIKNLEVSFENRLIKSEERISVMERLESIANSAATLCGNIVDGSEEDAPLDLRVKTAWDVLDRTGNTAPEKKIVGVVNAADMIIAAYKAKHKEEVIDT